MNSQANGLDQAPQHRADVAEIEQQLDALYLKTDQWAEQALAKHLLTKEQLQALHEFEQHKPDELFVQTANRPLVVAFFGGTGVGKSTLLNRFAGETVARTGVERPTSREVTLFIHDSVEIQQLPEDFPIEKVNLRQHQDETKRDILWIDMPDIDSVETENLAIVKEWLPYIDVLIYVVSSERYRDDRGWQFLVDQGYQHAWLFVINQWQMCEQKGLAEDSLIDDFAQILQRAGFDQAMIYRSECLADVPDDFALLQEDLTKLANQHTIVELDRRGSWNRLQHLQSSLQRQIEALGDTSGFDQIRADFRQNWIQASTDINEHLQWTIKKNAAQYARQSPTFSLRPRALLKAVKEPDQAEEPKIVEEKVWDQRAQSIVDTTITRLQLAMEQQGLSVKQLQSHMEQIQPPITERVENGIQMGLQQGILKPSNGFHRGIHRLLGLLTTLLPIAALVWVAYRVIDVFYTGNQDSYLGANFAIHSALLVLIAWLIPYFLSKKTQPSIETAARRGMQQGLAASLAELEMEIDSQIRICQDEHDEQISQAQQLIQQSQLITPLAQAKLNPTLQRMWQRKLHAGDSTPKLY